MDKFKKNILNFSEQLSLKTIEFSNLNKLKKEKIDAIIIIGMGGSGQIGDIIAGLKNELNLPVPIICWKDYGLPKTSFENPLYIFISFSGNTEETLSGLNNAKLKAIVTSGGKMLAMAKREKFPLASFINPGIKPRQGGGFMFSAALGILKNIFPGIKTKNIKINNPPAGGEKECLAVAEKMKGKIILLYSSQKNSYLAYNWKTRINETSKSLAFTGIIPEICHNEIEMLNNKKFSKNILIIFIKNEPEDSRVKQKIQKLEKVFKIKKINYLNIEPKGKNELERAWNCLVFADWTSYYLAKINKTNLAKTGLIDLLK